MCLWDAHKSRCAWSFVTPLCDVRPGGRSSLSFLVTVFTLDVRHIDSALSTSHSTPRNSEPLPVSVSLSLSADPLPIPGGCLLSAPLRALKEEEMNEESDTF